MGWFGRSGDGSATATDESLIERFIRENNWTPDVRHGHAFSLSFKGDAITPNRDVIVAHTPGNAIATFFCACRARFLASSMSPVQLALFLARNKQSLFGRWQITVEDGEVSAEVHYPALAAGLTAPIFKIICASLLSEVPFVEELMLGGAFCNGVPVPSREPIYPIVPQPTCLRRAGAARLQETSTPAIPCLEGNRCRQNASKTALLKGLQATW